MILLNKFCLECASFRRKCTVAPLTRKLSLYLTGSFKRRNRPESRENSQKFAQKTHKEQR